MEGGVPTLNRGSFRYPKYLDAVGRCCRLGVNGVIKAGQVFSGNPMKSHETEQERFWAGEFGNDYIDRNTGERMVTRSVVFWSRVLARLPKLNSVIELGCNAGLNLQALNRIDPSIDLVGYEINETAAEKCRSHGIARVEQGTILDPINEPAKFDLSFTRGVLIHINPDYLDRVYENLHTLSRRYVLVAEYYNPSPVAIGYRGHEDRLFKRDFAGDMIDRFGMTLLDYGFMYRRDNYFADDDVTWFLLEKRD